MAGTSLYMYYLENNPEKMRPLIAYMHIRDVFPYFHLTIRLCAQDFYRVILHPRKLSGMRNRERII